MFSNRIKYQSHLGIIKYSQADGHFQHTGKTKGLALKYVISGCEQYLIKDKIIKLYGGQMILLPPERAYEVASNQRIKNAIGLCIDLFPTEGALTPNRDQEENLLFSTPFACQHSIRLGMLLHTLLPGTKSQPTAPMRQTITEIEAATQSFSREINDLQKALQPQVKKRQTQQHMISRLIFARDFVHLHYRHKITWQALSKHTGLSQYHMARLFKLCFLQTPLELQSSLRLSKAKTLISEDLHSLTTIAHYLGFTDLASFSKQFKKKYGINPSTYRHSPYQKDSYLPE